MFIDPRLLGLFNFSHCNTVSNSCVGVWREDFIDCPYKESIEAVNCADKARQGG